MLKFLSMIVLILVTKNLNTTITMALVTVLFNLSLQTTINSKTSYFMSSDILSFWITSMSAFMFFILSFMKQKEVKTYSKIMMALILVLMMTFNSWNFMAFFILFEMSMVIILLIIISWGYQPERTEAMMFMVIMTLMFSLPFMMAIVMNNKMMNFWFMEITTNLLTMISFMFIFMMKMPIYFTHFWLPKVHVEAPVQGSMILAAILLKLGCYGMMRMNEIIMKFNKMKMIVIPASIVSMIILSIGCMMQTDLKTMIAYSSIVHMTTVFTNILIMKPKSMMSSLLIILGHGMCAAGLFFMANAMYEKTKSRSMLLNKGILINSPGMTLMWFMSCMNNAPMPPSMNMMGEIISFKNLLSWTEVMYMPIVIAAMVSSMYSIYMFCVVSHGKSTSLMNSLNVSTTKSLIMMTMMMTPITTMTAKPAMMML